MMQKSILFFLAFLASVSAFAVQIPHEINHQGVVRVSGIPFDGTGAFKFAILDATGTTTFWSNDGASLGGSEPTNAVSLPVRDGIYHVRLGDTGVANMTAIPATVFDDDNVVLRIWFDDGVNGIRQLQPDHPLTSAPYAFHALVADFAQTATAALNADTVDGEHASALRPTVVQVVSTQTGEACSISYIPVDDSVPQSTEGTEVMSLTISPTDADNTLKIDVVVFATAFNMIVAALFKNLVPDALAAGWDAGDNYGAGHIFFSHYMTAGTTEPITFSLRMGRGASDGGGGFNGDSDGTRRLGGVLASSITITETRTP